MTGRHKFSELQARLPPRRRARIARMVEKLEKQIDVVEAAPEAQVSQAVLQLLVQNPNGLTRGQIVERLRSNGYGRSEESIANALNMLEETQRISARDRKYIAA